MIHKCEYCVNTIKPCARPCLAQKDPSHVCCTCDIDITRCELPERIVCDSNICNTKFQVEYLETRIQELNQTYKDETEKIKELKELSNHFRILGIGPNSLETLIKTQGITLPFIIINKDPNFNWSILDQEALATLGLSFMRSYETLAKNWASFLNEKVLKVKAKKDLVLRTKEKLDSTSDSKDSKKSKSNSTNNIKESKSKVPKPSLKDLTPYEKIVLSNMKIGLSQKDAESAVKSMGMQGEAKDLTLFI